MVRPFRLIAFFLFCGLAVSAGAVQPDTTRTLVSVSSVLDSKQVPLNRTVDFIVRIAWEGDLETVDIGELTDPILSNLDVVGTATSNKVTGIPGGQQSVKEVTYTLKPKNLGMAYIEPVSLSYTDKKTSQVHALRTRRMTVEAVSPVPEKTGGPGAWFWILFLAAFASGIAAGGWYYLRQKKIKRAREAPMVQTILEEDFLIRLKETVDLKSKDRKESFGALTKLFRRYLSEEYGINATVAATEEWINALRERGTDEGLIRKCETLFTKADVIRFSGKEATQAELDEAYTVVEAMLESRLAEERQRLEKLKTEAEKKKSGKFGFLTRLIFRNHDEKLTHKI